MQYTGIRREFLMELLRDYAHRHELEQQVDVWPARLEPPRTRAPACLGDPPEPAPFRGDPRNWGAEVLQHISRTGGNPMAQQRFRISNATLASAYQHLCNWRQGYDDPVVLRLLVRRELGLPTFLDELTLLQRYFPGLKFKKWARREFVQMAVDYLLAYMEISPRNRLLSRLRQILWPSVPVFPTGVLVEAKPLERQVAVARQAK